MNRGEPQGCLTAILRLIGINLGGSEAARELPYRQRDDFLSAAELSFYRVLSAALGDRAVICPKVNLADIFFVVRPNENQSFRNKIDRKHVDFLICDPGTMQALCGIELDDSSHARRDRQERDEFVDQVFQVAGLPLVRVPAKGSYSPAGVMELIEPSPTRSPYKPRTRRARRLRYQPVTSTPQIRILSVESDSCQIECPKIARRPHPRSPPTRPVLPVLARLRGVREPCGAGPVSTSQSRPRDAGLESSKGLRRRFGRGRI